MNPQGESDLFHDGWDVIVIGTGLGGAAYGHALAQAGRRVLFIEQGHSFLPDAPGDVSALRGIYPESRFPSSENKPEEDALLRRAGRAWRALEDHSGRRPRAHRPLIGAGTGGSSLLYGMALERFLPEDFEPLRWHADAVDHHLPDRWPFGAEELAPYYAEAEALFQVHGSADPLKSCSPSYRPPAPLSSSGDELFRFFAARGLHPYRLPLGYDETRGDARCQGFLCADHCKRDALSVFLEPAVRRHGASLLSDAWVERLTADRTRVTSVDVVWNGRRKTFSAPDIVLAAGALETPALLLRSAGPAWPRGLANGSDQVGRNLLRHFIDLYAVTPPSGRVDDNGRKEIAFNDWALPGGGKLGTVQSFGRLPPATLLVDDLRRRAARAIPGGGALVTLLSPWIRSVVERIERHVILAAILEDLPYADNRVTLDRAGHPAITYRLRPYDAARIAGSRRRMRDLLSPLRPRLFKQSENNERIAHAAGTCRMGDDPSTSVVDGEERAHDLENLRIVDASVFPSAGGTNPGLTIVATARRAADRFLARNGASAARGTR